MSIKSTGYVPTGTAEEIKAAYESTSQGFEAVCVKRKFPVVHPEYPKHMGEHLWETSKSEYVFTDEGGNFSDKYTTLDAATDALGRYCVWLNQEKPNE